MASKCVNGALKWRLWVASVLSREPPGKELTYFLWLLSFWVQPLCNTVVQCRPDECSKKKKKKKAKFLYFYLPFTQASMHKIPFHIQTNIQLVIDMKMLLDPTQTHVNGICWGVRQGLGEPFLLRCVSSCLLDLPARVVSSACELTSEFEQGGAGK